MKAGWKRRRRSERQLWQTDNQTQTDQTSVPGFRILSSLHLFHSLSNTIYCPNTTKMNELHFQKANIKIKGLAILKGIYTLPATFHARVFDQDNFINNKVVSYCYNNVYMYVEWMILSYYYNKFELNMCKTDKIIATFVFSKARWLCWPSWTGLAPNVNQL